MPFASVGTFGPRFLMQRVCSHALPLVLMMHLVFGCCIHHTHTDAHEDHHSEQHQLYSLVDCSHTPVHTGLTSDCTGSLFSKAGSCDTNHHERDNCGFESCDFFLNSPVQFDRLVLSCFYVSEHLKHSPVDPVVSENQNDPIQSRCRTHLILEILRT